MKSKRLIIAAVGFFSFMAVASGVHLSSFSMSKNSELQNSSYRRVSTKETEFDPTIYVPVSNSELSATIRDYTGTSLSRYLDIQFESKAIKAFTTSKKDVYFVIDDTNYTGDNNNPFVGETPDKTLNGYIYTAERTSQTKNHTIYFPNTIKYGSKFTIKNTRIAEGCMSEDSDYGDITTIYICENIEVIDEGALINVPDTVTIKCAAESKPVGFQDGWTDAANILWGQPIDSNNEKNVSVSGAAKSFGEAKDYILGYQGKGDIGAYPLTISYDKTDVNGNVSTEYKVIPTKHTTNPYDAVGTSIYGNTNGFQLSIDLEKGEDIDEDSFRFYNIFEAKRNYTNDLSAWPVDKMNEIYSFYGVKEEFPTLDGDQFSYQFYESDSDKYITIHTGFDSDEEATVMLNEFVDKINAIVDEEDNKLFVPQTEAYPENKFGNVFRRDIVDESGEHFAMFAQAYVYEKHFISFLFIDHLVETTEVDEEEQEVVVYKTSRTIPIANKQAAIKPYYWAPDFDAGYFSAFTTKRFDFITDISDIFALNYVKSSSFLGYTSISLKVKKNFITAYAAYLFDDVGNIDDSKMVALVKKDGVYYSGKTAYQESEVQIVGSFTAPEVYMMDNASRSKVEININSLLSGSVAFRYVLADLNNAKLIVTYLKGNEVLRKDIPISSPSPVIELNRNEKEVSFLVNSNEIEGVSPENIVALGVGGMTVNIHLYNSSSHSVVQNTSFLKVFGNVEVLPYSTAKLTYFNINTYLILFIVIFTALFAVLTVVLFFYLKNKYKNDEFRRMRPKAFIKTALGVFLGSLLIAVGANFIVLRFAIFSSSVPVFNPIDPFVIAFGLAAAISIGLFVRMFVIMGKANKKRREARRLHLDRDLLDDGTH